MISVESPSNRSIQSSILFDASTNCFPISHVSCIVLRMMNDGIYHARAFGQSSSIAASRAVLQFFVPEVSEARQHGLEYSRFVLEPAIKFCRSLVSSVEISKPRRSRRARRSAIKDFVLFVSFVVVINATINQFAAPIMNLPITLANRRHLRSTSSQSIAACEVCLSRYVGPPPTLRRWRR